MNSNDIIRALVAMGKELFSRNRQAKPFTRRNYGRTGGGRMRGVGYTRKSHAESKTRRKMAAHSRKINWRS